MCGIIGYAGVNPATPILVDSLRRLEYRGYDSAGIAVLGAYGDRATVFKSERKVDDLALRLSAEGVPLGHVGIGHTRWATHGNPTLVNAHPHTDCTGRIHLIHNGIIENYAPLKAGLMAAGHHFSSDTDTEVVAHLIEDKYDGDLSLAVRLALNAVSGTYALVVVAEDQPDVIVGARLNSPLVVGTSGGDVYISSDPAALIPYTRDIFYLGEGQIVTGSEGGITVTTLEGEVVKPLFTRVEWDAEQAEKGGFPHFFLKEIYDQPESAVNCMRGRVAADGGITLESIDGMPEVTTATIIACGTARYAGMVGRLALERLAGIRTDVVESSEFRYCEPVIQKGHLVVAISQSGETADTLAAAREARSRGAYVIAVTNVQGSALTRIADSVLYMQAGPEISVAATKTFVTQLLCVIMLAAALGRMTGAITEEQIHILGSEMLELPDRMTRTLELQPAVVKIVGRYAHLRQAIFIGRDVNVAVALEGALKLKELAYVYAEGYPAGELKHGPIALLEASVLVIALATQSSVLPKLVSNVSECRVRNAPVMGIVTEGHNPFSPGELDEVLEVPFCSELLAPVINVIPLQLFAYHTAVARGCNVDQPRNLAKSVTVE